jgi:predicted AlkP superfamily pyrophosphatase or phosphodiesterase
MVVSVDGLRPDAIARFGASTLQRLMEEGSYTLAATTTLPSKTLPSHTSMLTGEPPERHRVRWNTVATARSDAIDVPTVFTIARMHGYRTAAFFSKPKFQPLQRAGTLDYSQAPGGWWGGWLSGRTTSDVEKYLAGERPNVLFVHLADPDLSGHRYGWMTAPYGRAVRAVDSAIARLTAAGERAYGHGRFTLIVTADHGGHGNNHGSSDPRDVTIPWIAWGRGVKPGELPPGSVRTMDTAATVVWLLGLRAPAGWAGTPVVAAFMADAPTIAAPN